MKLAFLKLMMRPLIMTGLRSERMPQHSGKYEEELTPTLTTNFNLQVADAQQSAGQSSAMWYVQGADNAMTSRHATSSN